MGRVFIDISYLDTYSATGFSAAGKLDRRSSFNMDRLLRAELQNLDAELATTFDRIYEESLKIWNSELRPKFTSHGRAHTEQVEDNLDKLTRPLQSSNKPLTKHEIFVLLAGTCLHDIGMQLIDDPNARDNHAVAARELILYSWDRVPGEQRRVTLPIDDRNARVAIANVARAHWVDYALPLPSRAFIHGNEKGRLRLLGLLLSMADLLDLSSVRAHYFRSNHRLYDLGPIPELHHAKHHLVEGFTIGPANKNVPGSLRFDLEWNENNGLVEIVSDWVMQWFNSQWRQMQGALFHESGGEIGWTHPWANVVFHEAQGFPTTMSPEAENFLRADRAEQIRIDREALTLRFREALSNGEVAVFLFPPESDFVWRRLSEWCEAYSRAQDNCHVAKVDASLSSPYQFASTVAQILHQWNKLLPVCSDEEAAAFLESFLKLADSPNLVTIIRTNEPVSASLENLLKMLVRRNSNAARVCLLICPKAKGPSEIGDASIIEFDGSVFPREEIEQHLQKQHGFTVQESREIYERMERVNLTARPAHVYTYIEDHCRC